MSSKSPRSKTPWLIGLIPVFPVLYAAAFGFLGYARTFNPLLRGVMIFFVVTQLVAALFTPNPAISLVTAAFRCTWLLAMVCAGIYLGQSERLRPLLFGYLAVFATAWVSTLATVGLDIQHLQDTRLLHPYYYFVSLGLMCAIAGWQIISWQGGSSKWRLLAGVFVAATFLATGSRGALLAFVVGALAAAIRGNKRYGQVLLVFMSLGLIGFFAFPQLRQADVLGHLASLGLSGRDEVWQGAIKAFENSPWGGVGVYQLGWYLTFLFKDGCNLTPFLMHEGVGCSAWLEAVRGVWLQAHNLGLHLLAETGLIGIAGWIAVFSLSAVAAWRSKNSLVFGVFCGFMAMNMIDVVSLGPSMNFAEFFWVCMGIAFKLSGYVNNSEAVLKA